MTAVPEVESAAMATDEVWPVITKQMQVGDYESMA
jgi:hypothetical protein